MQQPRGVRGKEGENQDVQRVRGKGASERAYGEFHFYQFVSTFFDVLHAYWFDYVMVFQVNVVKGLKVYEDIFTDPELFKLSEFINELRLAGHRGELSGLLLN